MKLSCQENSKVTPRSFAEELKHLNGLVGMILNKISTEPYPHRWSPGKWIPILAKAYS